MGELEITRSSGIIVSHKSKIFGACKVLAEVGRFAYGTGLRI